MNQEPRNAMLSDDKLIRRLVSLVDRLGLSRRDFVIFGSGPLLAHGMRKHIQDLDIVARGATWRTVCEYGLPATGSINGAPLAAFWGGLVQFSSGWISEDWDVDDLIVRAEVIDGLPFAELSDVLRYKQILRRPKDHPDIRTLVDMLDRHGDRLSTRIQDSVAKANS